MRRLRCRDGDSEAGAAMVEFAVILPVFVGLVVGILRFGLLMHTQLELSTAAQEGARAAYLNRSIGEVTSAAVAAGAAVNVTGSEVAVTDKDGNENSCLDLISEDVVTVTVSRPASFDWVLGTTSIVLEGKGVVRCP